MGETNWTDYTTATTVLSTELNSLADGAESSLSSAIDNSTDKDMLADFEVYLGTLSASSSPYVILKVYSAVDGANYDDGDGSPGYPLKVSASTGPKRGSIRMVPLSPGLHKVTLNNEANASFAASGSTVKIRKYSPTTA